MPYVGRDFDALSPVETKDLTLDFKPWLGPCDTISSATWAIALEDGTDATPTSRLSGSTLVSCGSKVTRRATTLQDGAKYRMTALATLNDGEVLELYSFIRGKA